jgi:hypothetical protein
MQGYMYRIRLTYKNVNDLGLLLKVQDVLKGMTGNTRFPNPPVALAAIQTSLDEYAKVLPLAKKGNDEAIAQKKILRKTMQEGLHGLAGYVVSASKNDPDVLASSGFDITKQPVGPTRDEFSIEVSEEPGMVISTMRSVRKAKMYIHQYTTDPNQSTGWTGIPSTQRKFILTGLQSNVKYWFRVKAVIRDGQDVYTDVVSKTVQ